MQKKYNPNFSLTQKIKDILPEIDLLMRLKSDVPNQNIGQVPFLYKKTDDQIKAYISARLFLKDNRKQPITKTLLRDINNIVEPKILSSYETDGGYIYNLEGGIVYCSPLFSEMYIDSAMKWYESSSAASLPFPIQAAIVHCQIVKIHPFRDGNGRTAKLVSSDILIRSGVPVVIAYRLEDLFNINRKAYDDALDFRQTNEVFELFDEGVDMTSWIEYFCNSLYECLKK